MTKKSKYAPKKYIIDIDGTICTTIEGGDYYDAKPLKDRIEYFNKLYDDGNFITYWTARGSTTGINWIDLTAHQLVVWGVKHHEVKVGKPEYDVWIDDKCINPDDLDRL